MLRSLHDLPFAKEQASGQIGMRIEECHFPAPFQAGLEYSSPARGTWNIVHTGMLIPQTHQIFVCAKGCLRGVVLTAAEMNAMDRYSAIEIREENVLNGGMEELMINGVADILGKLKYRPRAILLFISCQHFFLAYDKEFVFESLRERFPDIRFVDCYMIPTLRKSGITPDQKMRIQMYRMLEKDRTEDGRQTMSVNLIGSNHVPGQEGELVSILRKGGFLVRALNWCETFEEYLQMEDSGFNLYFDPIAKLAAEDLKERLNQEALYIPAVFRPEQIEMVYEKLSNFLGIRLPDLSGSRRLAGEAICQAKKVAGSMPIALDATFTFRILNLTRLLLENGFVVNEIYADAFLPEEEEDFLWIREHAPQIRIYPTNQPGMRVAERSRDQSYLALGQKAAYFTGTNHFVNMTEGGGLFGYEGVKQVFDWMAEAVKAEKNREEIIQRKGFGCESCI